jgi:ribosomal protein S18 acetylase RimI-like enzyme
MTAMPDFPANPAANAASGPDIAVREARAADAEVIAEFNIRLARETEDTALEPAVVLSGVRRGIADPARARYFVAEVGGRVAGQLMLTKEWSDWRDGDIWWIQSVYVAAEFRRLGVFRRLFGHVESLAAAEGVAGLRLYIEEHNEPARRTYESLGMITAHYRVMEKMRKA